MKKEDRESNWPGKIINFCLINTFIDSGIQILQRYVIQHQKLKSSAAPNLTLMSLCSKSEFCFCNDYVTGW